MSHSREPCPQCGHYWQAGNPIETCAVGIGGGELCSCPSQYHHEGR